MRMRCTSPAASAHGMRRKMVHTAREKLTLRLCVSTAVNAAPVRDDGVRKKGNGERKRGGGGYAQRKQKSATANAAKTLAARCAALGWDWEAALVTARSESASEKVSHSEQSSGNGRGNAPFRLAARQVTSFVVELSRAKCGRALLTLWPWMQDYNDRMREADGEDASSEKMYIDHKNIYAYTALLAALAPLSNSVYIEEIFAVFDELQRECNAPPDVVVYSSLVSACEKRGMLDDAKRIIKDMRAAGIKPNVVTYNSYIRCTARKMKLDDALEAYEEMKKEGLKPDVITYSSMIAVYGSLGDHRSALHMFEEMKRRSIRANHITYNSLISACEKAGRWDAAFAVFVHMRASGISTSSTPFNALVAAAEKGGLRGLVPPREVTGRAVETVLTALVKLEGLGLAMDAFRSFCAEKRYPAVSWHSYSYLLTECEATACTKSGATSASSSTSSSRQRRGSDASTSVAEAADFAMEVYENLIRSGLTPTHKDVASIVRVLLAAQRSDEAVALIEQLETYTDGSRERKAGDDLFSDSIIDAAEAFTGTSTATTTCALHAALLRTRAQRGLDGQSEKMKVVSEDKECCVS